MTNNDYIRRAVDLATGWKIIAGSVFSDGVSGCAPLANLPTMIKDALAAQLTRQVDALASFHVETYEGDSCVMEADGIFNEDNCIADSAGSDRTMNTLKCIIDSKVLNTDGPGEGNE